MSHRGSGSASSGSGYNTGGRASSSGAFSVELFCVTLRAWTSSCPSASKAAALPTTVAIPATGFSVPGSCCGNVPLSTTATTVPSLLFIGDIPTRGRLNALMVALTCCLLASTAVCSGRPLAPSPPSAPPARFACWRNFKGETWQVSHRSGAPSGRRRRRWRAHHPH